MRMEVRCCCQPKKLLGWLDVRYEDANSAQFPLMNQVPITAQFDDTARIEIKHLVLSVGKIYNDGRTYRAIKSEETPIETLRLIPGFIEAPDAEHSH